MTKNIRPAGVPDGESHFISVGANRIHYVTAGKGGRTIVFIHGWACNLGFWREQVSMLADKARLILLLSRLAQPVTVVVILSTRVIMTCTIGLLR